MPNFSALPQLPWATIAIACGPLTASTLAYMMFGKNRVLLMFVRGGAAWLAMQVLISPYLHFAKDQLRYLMEITSR